MASRPAFVGIGVASLALVAACSLGLDSAEFASGNEGSSSGGDAGDGSSGGSSGGDGSAADGSSESDAAAALDGSSSGDADTGTPAPPCLVPGDRCPDGTVFAGALQGSSVKLFTTPCDHGQSLQGT